MRSNPSLESAKEHFTAMFDQAWALKHNGNAPAVSLGWLFTAFALLPVTAPATRFEFVETIDYLARTNQLGSLSFAFTGEHTLKSELMFGRKRVEDYWRVYLSAMIASHRRFLFQLGLVKLKKKGDLRAVVFQTDPFKILPILIRNPELPDCALDRLQKQIAWLERAFRHCDGQVIDARAKDRLRKALQSRRTREDHADTPVFGDGRMNTKLQELLLAAWATKFPVLNETDIPPLAYFSDLGLAKLVQTRIIGERNDPSDMVEFSLRVRMVWERLGLRKSRFSVLDVVSDENGTVTLEAQRGKRLPKRFPSFPLLPVV